MTYWQNISNLKRTLAVVKIDYYILQMGYEYDDSYGCNKLYARIFDINNGYYLGGAWIQNLESDNNLQGLTCAPKTLIDEIIKQSRRIEKLKAFI